MIKIRTKLFTILTRQLLNRSTKEPEAGWPNGLRQPW